MPKRIDSSVWKAIKNSFLRRTPKPTYKDLADEFGVSKSSIEDKASKERWQEERDNLDDKAVSTAHKISHASGRRINPVDALNGAIADLYYQSQALDGKSKEGCAGTMAVLLKTQRELYPPTFPEWVDMLIRLNITPTPDEIVELTIQVGITPDTYLEALKRRWAQGLEQPVDQAKVK